MDIELAYVEAKVKTIQGKYRKRIVIVKNLIFLEISVLGSPELKNVSFTKNVCMQLSRENLTDFRKISYKHINWVSVDV